MERYKQEIARLKAENEVLLRENAEMKAKLGIAAENKPVKTRKKAAE